MKKVAIVHGSYLHRRHCSLLAPLEERYELVGVGTRRSALGATSIGFEVRRLLGIADITKRIPKVRHRIGWGADQYLFGFDKALKDIDVFYTGSPTCLFAWQSARLKKKTGAKLVVCELENIPYLDADRWIWRYRQDTLEAADAVIATTERARWALIAEGVDPNKIWQIPIGVDTTLFSPEHRDSGVLRPLGVEPGEKVVLFAGRLIWDKGVFELAYAANRVLKDPELAHIPVKFVFIGNGSGESALRRRIGMMGIADRVLLAGFTPYDKMPTLYASTDIAVVPSIPTPAWVEQGSSMMLECMASGTAVIATQCGGIPEMTGDTAILVNPADHMTLFHAIRELLLDDVRRQDMGRRARERAVTVLDSRKTADRTGDVFDLVCGR